MAKSKKLFSSHNLPGALFNWDIIPGFPLKDEHLEAGVTSARDRISV
jgi:hypothetical protein